MDFSKIDALMKSDDSSDRRMAASMLAEVGGDTVIERLIALLKDTNSGVRDAAQNALMILGGRKAVEKIAPLVLEIDPGLRNAAIDILRKIGEDGLDIMLSLARHENDYIRLFVFDILGTLGNPEGVDVLIAGLFDANPNVRNAAVVSLGMIRDPRSFDHVKRLIDDEEWIRFSAIEALSHIPHQAVPEFLLGQLKRFSHDDLTVSALLESLGKIKSKQSVGTLIGLLESANAYIESELVKALLKILTPEEIAALPQEDSSIIKTVIDQHLSDAEDDLLKDMLAALKVIGDHVSALALIELARLTDPDTMPERFSAITDALIHLGDRDAMVELLDGEDKLKILAAKVLAHIGKVDDALLLCDRVFSCEGYVKRAFTDALAAIGGHELRETYLRLLTDMDGHVIASALRALGMNGDPADIDEIEPYLSHTYPDVSEAALISIVKIGTAKAEDVFIMLTQDAEPDKRVMGLMGLDRMDSSRLGKVAQNLLRDPDGEVRAAAVRAIRDRNLSISFDMLQGLLTDENRQIRYMAIDIVGMRRLAELRGHLEDALIGDDMWAASHAIDALGMFRDHQAKTRLLDVMGCGSDFLKITSIKALGQWEDVELSFDLEPYLDDTNPDVARAVADAIDRLQGVNF